MKEEGMSINVYELIDNRVKAELDRRERRNNDLREQLFRVTSEKRTLHEENETLKRELKKIAKNQKVYGNISDNLKKRISEEEEVREKLNILQYYISNMLCLDADYEIPDHVIDGSVSKMIYYLFYKYNNNKSIISELLLSVMDKRYRDCIQMASSYIVPQKRNKDVLIKLIKEQRYYCNGGHREWLSCCFPDNPPYKEYMKNPLFLDDEVFRCLCDNICRKSEGLTFLDITKYQKLSDAQIEMLAEGIVKFGNKDVIEKFFYSNHFNIPLETQRKIFDIIGYSCSDYSRNFIFNYKDEIVEDILKDLDEVKFTVLYNIANRQRAKLLKMYMEMKRKEDNK